MSLRFAGRSILYIFLSVCGLHLLPGSTLASGIGLADAWQTVTSKNNTLKAAEADVSSARHKKAATKSLYLPEINLLAGFAYLDKDVELSPQDVLNSMPAGQQLAPVIGGLASSYGISAAQLNSGLTSTVAERDNLSSSISASWPIYTGGRISAAQDIAASQVQEARHHLTLETENQFLTLVRYYFGAVLAQKVLTTRLEAESGLKKHFDHAVLLEEQGQIAKVERMQSAASYDKAVVERQKANRDLEIAQAALTSLLQQKVATPPADPLFIGSPLPPMADCIDKTLASSAGLAVLAAKQEQATGLVAIEKGKYHPTVAVLGNYTLYEEDNLATTLVPDWMVGVGVSIPLTERSGRAGHLRAAQSSIDKIAALRAQARSDLSLAIEQTYRHTEQALEEYNGLSSSEKLAQETVLLRGKAFSQGLSTSLDVVDAELFLAGVKTQRAMAVYNYVLSLARLCVLSGQLEQFFNYQLSPTIEVR